MKLTKDTNIEGLIKDIYANSQQGEVSFIEMYGYKMYLPPYMSMDAIRINIIVKLKAIKQKESNLKYLKESGFYSKSELSKIAKYTPDIISDIVGELPHYSHYKKHSTK